MAITSTRTAMVAGSVGAIAVAFFFGRAFPANSPESAKVIDLIEKTRREVQGVSDSIQLLAKRTATALPVIPPANTGNQKLLDGPGPDVDDLVKEGERLRSNKKLREAELTLTRAIQTDHESIAAWRALAAVQRDFAISSVDTGDLLGAAQAADRAKASVNAIKAVSVDPATRPVDPKIIFEEEKASANAEAKVRDAIDAACQTLIGGADQSGHDAFHSTWNVFALGIRPIRNDRDKVVEALKSLKKVCELGPWMSETTRMSATDVFSYLKQRVYAEEWNDLLARAGFDPSSRDALRKWGLD
jgi:hypothetical protein